MLSTVLCAAVIVVLFAAAAMALADQPDPEPVRRGARRGKAAVIVYRDAVRKS